ncbi:MAG: exodeoxyribonuclease V subunit alpha, partial [Acidimicrobiales bacterium]
PGLAADRSGRFPLVALSAPTGKAAARLGEAVADMAAAIDDEAVRAALAGVVPSTIHRLLGWHYGRARFAHNAGNRLPHDLVIVDEMSMVSLPMAAKLLAAVRDDATVVFVGDPFQLESIEAGTVLADIVGPAAEMASSADPPGEAAIRNHVVLLDRVHRFESDSAIGEFSEAIRSGDDTTAVRLLGGDDDHLRWIRDRTDPAFAALWDALVGQRQRLVELSRQPGNEAAALEAVSEMAVLCAHRRGANSVWRWGRDLEVALDERFTGLRWGSEWYPGRPVMVTRNDYNLDLYNGDIGVAVETDDGLRVVFDRGGIRTFPLSQLGEYATVHAMTIHKSQGSQFEEVVVVLPGEESRLLTRQLLYTAVTRARKRVWIVGGESAVRQAVGRSVQRASGLRARLWGKLG